MNERRNLRFHLLRLTNLETENGLVVNRNTHMLVLANLGTPPAKYYVKKCLPCKKKCSIARAMLEHKSSIFARVCYILNNRTMVKILLEYC